MFRFQFQDDMLRIALAILDLSHKHFEDPVADVAARSDVAYVSRVVSAMVRRTTVLLQNCWGVRGNQKTCHKSYFLLTAAN